MTKMKTHRNKKARRELRALRGSGKEPGCSFQVHMNKERYELVKIFCAGKELASMQYLQEELQRKWPG